VGFLELEVDHVRLSPFTSTFAITYLQINLLLDAQLFRTFGVAGVRVLLDFLLGLEENLAHLTHVGLALLMNRRHVLLEMG
jgi:hypothetical protein